MTSAWLTATRPDNVERLEHVAPADHAAFYSAGRCTLNITRADMIAAGFSPSVRLFEASARATAIISDLLSNPRFEVLRHDVTFPLYVEGDDIYNPACPASPIHYQFDPVQTTKTSVMGAINMLWLAKRTRARILQASTSEVYGDPTISLQPETYRGNVNPLGPRVCYNEGKRCAEALFFDYQRQHGTRFAKLLGSLSFPEPTCSCHTLLASGRFAVFMLACRVSSCALP
jgi:hypothetical protein